MAHNAPGKHYRKGLSMVQLTKMFPDDETAERWFVKTRWPNGIACPKCGSMDIKARETRKPQPYYCRDCQKYFSVKTDSLMHNSPVGLPGVGDCDLPAEHQHQGRLVNAAAP